MRTPGTPEAYVYNPNNLAWLTSVSNADNPNTRTRLIDIATQISQTDDLSPLQRDGHIIGMLAAQLTLNYTDGADGYLHPVAERAVDIGMLGALGDFITCRTPLYEDEMACAEVYQRQMLLWRVLDDPPGPTPYAIPSSRQHSSLFSLMQYLIRSYPTLVASDRAHHQQWHAEIVKEYRDKLDTTMPTDEQLPEYQKQEELSEVINRFQRLRHSLRAYIPVLTETEPALWRYAKGYLRKLQRHNSEADQPEYAA